MLLPAPAVAPVIPPVTVPTVHVNVLGVLEASVMFGLVLLQIETEGGLVTAGVGFTVTVIVYGVPTQLPVTEVGVMIYCTVPAVALLGLVSVWLIVLPVPADAPETLPVIDPIVHAKVDGALDASEMFGLVLLQIETAEGLVTTGLGFTVTVIVNGDPVHVPVVEVGVMIYSTEPAVALLGLFNVWLMRLPEPVLAPVMPPLIAPIVHVNELGALAVNEIFGLVPVQIEVAGALVTAGVGFTVTVMVNGAPTQLPVTEVGVTIYCTEPAVALLGLVKVWLIRLPDPAVAPVIPPDTVPIVQVKLLGADAVRLMFGLVALQIDIVAGLVTAGVGFTVTVMV
jgi:predicted transcriptional regulator